MQRSEMETGTLTKSGHGGCVMQPYDSLCQSQAQSQFQSTGRKCDERRQSQRTRPEEEENRPLNLKVTVRKVTDMNQSAHVPEQDRPNTKYTKPSSNQQALCSNHKQQHSNLQQLASSTIFESNMKEKPKKHKHGKSHADKSRRSKAAKEHIEKSMLLEM